MAEGGKILKKDIIEQEAIEIALKSMAVLVGNVITKVEELTTASKALNTSLKSDLSLKGLSNSSKLAERNVAANNEVSNSLKEIGEYYKELEERERKYYNSSISNKNQAIKNLQDKIAKLKKERDAIEYDMIGAENKRGRHNIAKDQSETLEYMNLLTKEIKEAELALNALNKHKMGGNPADIKKITAELTEENFELLQMKKHYEQLEKAEAAKNSEMNKSKTSLEAQRTKAYTAELKKNEATQRLLIQARSTEAGSLERLNAVNNLYRQRMKELNVLIPAQAAQYDRLNKSLIANNQRMMAMGTAAQKGGRQFNMLQWQIMQVSRELPAFAYGINVGIGALSNNLPMLFDEIDNVRRANALLAKEGKPTTSVLKQIAGSLISWQTALVVGVTLITLYGREIGEWIKKITKGKEAIDSLKLAQESLKKATDAANESSMNEKTTLDILYRASQNTKKTLEERNAAIDEMQKMYPSYLGNFTNEEIIAGKAAGAYANLTKVILAKAKAQAFADEIAANELKIVKDLFPQYDEINSKIAKQQKLVDSLSEQYIVTGGGIMAGTVNTALQSAENKLNSLKEDAEYVFAQMIAIRETNKKLESQIDTSKIGLDFTPKEDKSTKDSILATAKAMRDRLIGLKEKELAERASLEEDTLFNEKEREKELSEYKIKLNQDMLNNIKMSEKDQLDFLDEIESEKTDIVLRETKYRNKIYELAGKEQEKLSKEGIEIRKQVSDDFVASVYEQADLARIKRAEQARIEMQDLKGNAKKKKSVQIRAAIDMLAIEYKAQQQILDSNKTTEEEKAKAAEMQLKLKEQLEVEALDGSVEMTKLQRDEYRKTVDAVSQIGSQMFDVIGGFYDNQMTKIEQMHDLEIAMAGDSVEKRIMAERKYEKEKAKIMRKQAVMQKAQSAFNIIINTAEAIMATLGETGFFGTPLAIIIGALGAAQLAMVLAAPIPTFAKGTKDAPATFVAGEAGQEAIIKPSGQVVLTPDAPTVFSDKSFVGSTILPADQTQRMLANYAIKQSYDMIDMSESNKTLKQIANNTKNKREVFVNSQGRTVIKRGYITSTLV